MFALSDQTVTIATAIIALLGTCFTGYMTYLMARLNAEQKTTNKQQKLAAVKVEEVAAQAVVAAEQVQQVAVKAEDAAAQVQAVAEKLDATAAATDAKLDDIAKTGQAVHILVNSSMSAQLKISSIALRRVADLTKNKDDRAAADLAEKLYHEHEQKQAKVDSLGGAK